MSLKQYFRLLASYDQRVKAKLYDAAGQLAVTDLAKDRGAFFGSIPGILNHIVVGDAIWLKRFSIRPSCLTSLREVAELPSPANLDKIIFNDFNALHNRRRWLDEKFNNWVGEFSDEYLNFVLSYRSIMGLSVSKLYLGLILHFFNHKTHHLGQVSALFSLAGVDIGVTDFLVLIPDGSHGNV